MKKSKDYLEGFYDGFMAARVSGVVTPQPPTVDTKCHVCGMDFANKVWGYVCNHNQCPSKMSWAARAATATMMGNNNES